MALRDDIEAEIWNWIRGFVAAPNEFYNMKFAPCPFAQRALNEKTVDVVVWESGEVRDFIREKSEQLRDQKKMTTRVMSFPPRVQHAWGVSEFVESLNTELVPDDIFLNTGIAKTTKSLYPKSGGKPYFVVVANRLGPVMKGSESLLKTKYYDNWPEDQFEIVVSRRARMVDKHGKKQTPSPPG